MSATREDAALVVELAKWRSMLGVPEASRAVYADDFDVDAADPGDPHVSAMLFFHETLGTLVENGLLDRGLVHDWLWVQGAWERVGPAALRSRERAGVPGLWANFESLATSQVAAMQPA